MYRHKNCDFDDDLRKNPKLGLLKAKGTLVRNFKNNSQLKCNLVYSFFIALAAILLSSCSDKNLSKDIAILSNWQAGESVSKESVEDFGLGKCFVSSEIDEKLFSRIKGLSYKNNCTTLLSELRYIKVLHYDADEKILLGEMICNKIISKDLLEIFTVLYNNRYPIEKMVLIDNYGADDGESMKANNSSAFNFRFIAGTTRLSSHSLGLAVDINSLYNPYVRYKGEAIIVDPIEATLYVDRNKDFPYKINEEDLCFKEFSRHGFIWGGHGFKELSGTWRGSLPPRKDYQHFEKLLNEEPLE